jgi:hypothetical protein
MDLPSINPAIRSMIATPTFNGPLSSLPVMLIKPPHAWTMRS